MSPLAAEGLAIGHGSRIVARDVCFALERGSVRLLDAGPLESLAAAHAV